MNDNVIKSQAIIGVNRMIKTIKNLESQQVFVPETRIGITSNPPTEAEITAIYDTPVNVGEDYIGAIRDNTNSRYWIVWTDALNWFYVQINLAL